MGSRMTRAAPHLSKDEVYKRMQKEQRHWCRKRWAIVYQALKAPRQADEIARTVGVSVSSVHRVISTSNRKGVAALETPGKGGRRRQYLTLSQERAFLQPFEAQAAQGKRVTVAEIQQAYEQRSKQSVASSTISRLLTRHGWKRHRIGSHPAPKLQRTSGQKDTRSGGTRRDQKGPPKAKQQQAG